VVLGEGRAGRSEADAVNPVARGWIHTVYRDDSWCNEIEGEEGHSTRYRNRRDAAEAGRMLARWLHTEHLLHNQDGTIAERTSYVRDRPPG